MKKKVAMFPGQGNVYVGMCKSLLNEHEIARRTFKEASEAIDMDLIDLCLNGDLKDLTKTENAQPAILTASVAAFRVLKEEFGFRPHFFAGHSLGEFSALTCAEYIEFRDAGRLVKIRGQLMRDAAEGSEGLMTAIGKVPKNEILAVCENVSTPDSIVCVSNYNSLKQNVISGHRDAVVAAEKRLADLGASVKRLNVSAPFHSPLMQPALEQFKRVLERVSFRDSGKLVLSNVTAKPHVYEEIKSRLAQQLVSPVRWQETVEYLKTQQIRVAVDVGPGKVLRNLMFDNFPSIRALSYDVADNARELEKLLGTEKVTPFVSRCMGLAVATKNNCADAQIYENEVVEPYRRLQLMQQTIDAEERAADPEEMRLARELLIRIFTGKRISAEEQEARLQTLYLDTETETIFA
ncbi:MAG: ACP S-malonyltransferase [Oscillospiraceae bacterium]|nr:ACP S-malonyltransferase [Oscillospiraceae bacterium]